jgi:hypothetical protein
MAESPLREFVDRVVKETRQDDIEKIRMANNSYIAVSKHLSGLGKDLRKFQSAFTKNNGWMETLTLSTSLPRNEHIDLEVSFLDRGFHNVSNKIKARAMRVKEEPNNPLNFKLKGFIIAIYFDAPPEVKKNPKVYNAWFAKNVEDIFSQESIRLSYVHEFIHVMDFRRMDPAYLQQRTNKKETELAKVGSGKRDFSKYINDPLELNAYFSQALFGVRRELRTASTPEEKQGVIGKTASEFVEKFMGSYLPPQVRRNLSPDNKQRMMKRAATAWELLASGSLVKEQVDETMFHGTATDFDKFKLNKNGILWLAYEPETSQAYASFAARNKNTSNSFLWQVELSSKARIIDMEDLSNPIIQQIKKSLSDERKMRFGSEIDDKDWKDYANFGSLEYHPWIRKFLKSKRIDGIIVNDSVTTTSTKHKSIALFNLAVITDTSRVSNQAG